MDEPTEVCDNCQQTFPQSKIGTHFAYCRRNIKKCLTCNKLYDINFQEQHQEQYHKQQLCSYCQKHFPSSEIKVHSDNCNKKPMFCEYCDLNVPVEIFSKHFKQCESRTKPCTKCNRPITNKQYLIHIVSCNGPSPQTVKPNNYNQYLQQNRRKFEENKQQKRSEDIIREERRLQELNREAERERKQQIVKEKEDKKPFQAQKRNDFRSIREEPLLEEKKYVPISYTSGISRDLVYQIPSKQETQKREIKDYIEIKKEQPKYTFNRNLNPQLTFSYNQESKTYNNPSVQSNQSKIPISSLYQPKDTKIVSNKDIFPQSRLNQPLNPSNSYQRRQQEGRPAVQYKKYLASNIQRVQAPQSKQKIIYSSKPIQVSPPTPDYREQLSWGALGISPEQQQMQMAILQSMGTGKSDYEFESEFNESFIAEQKEIQKRIGLQRGRK